MTDDERSCDRDRVWAMAAGALDDAERAAFEAHLAGCTGCAIALAEVRADLDALGYGRAASSDALANDVLARSRRVQARARRLRWIAVGGLLVGGTVTGLLGAHRLAVRSVARREMTRLEHTIQRIRNVEGAYPQDEAALVEALARHPDPEVALDLGGRPLDRWGQPFRYRFPGENVPGLFDLWSAGPNGEDQDGTKDDLANWK